MAGSARPDIVCQSGDLVDGGAGFHFVVESDGKRHPAFVVRYQGRAYAYRNVCAHRGVTLDWDDGRFFDITGDHLVCSAHGALYEPDSGRCASGSCRGLGLTPIAVTENDGVIRLASTGDILFAEPKVTEQTS